jgi:cell division protease FtsH
VAAAALLLALLLGSGSWLALRTEAEPGAAPVPFSELLQALSTSSVERLTLSGGGSLLTAELSGPREVEGEGEPAEAISAVVPRGSLELADLERWAAAGIEVQVEPSTGGGASPWQLLSTLALFGVLMLLVVRLQRGGLTARRFQTTPEERRLTLSDVGGAREAQADLRDVIAYLKDPSRFQAMGAKCPTGVLLIGPPGTGKTLLARAVAGESGRPVIVTSGSEFTEMYVGVGARRVRELAKQARAKAPCIVFIDEFDSVGGRRGRPNRSGEEETTLNQLLVEMDGLAGSAGVVWMAATNREDMLDPAVRRPGRFDRVVEVGMPTATDRLEILRIHAGKRPLAGDVDLQRLAALTVGYSGADLENLLNEAAILAVQEESVVISEDHIEQARDRILLGRVRSGMVVSDEERRLVALHEAGHAVVGLVACPEDRLHKVTIEPRGRSLGAAHFAPDADRHLYSRRYLEGTIAKALGGRAAELVFLGPDAVTSGAGSDLVHATRIARQMVAEFGMSEEVGLVSASPAAQGGAGASAQLQGQIDGAVRSLIAAQMQRAEALVRRHREAVEALADALIRESVLSASDVHAIAAIHGVPTGLLVPSG